MMLVDVVWWMAYSFFLRVAIGLKCLFYQLIHCYLPNTI